MEKEIIKKLVSVTKEIYNTIDDEDYCCILGKVKEIEMQIFALNIEEHTAIIDMEEYDEYREAVRCLNDEDNCLKFEAYKDKYDRTYVLLFHFFEESSLKAEQDCVLEFLEDKIVEVENFYIDIHNDLNNIYDLCISPRKRRRYRVDRNIAANLINACIVLNLFDKVLSRIKSEEFNAIKANDISGLSVVINSWICHCLMDYEFQNNEYLDFEANYMPNVALVDNCRYMHEHKMRVENVLEYNQSPLNHDMMWCEEKIFEIYKKSISNEIDFVKLQALLILIEQSPFFRDSSRSIAREMIYTFKELLVNTSIEKLVMEINMFSSEMEVGAKATTKMEIFFFLENEDRYCLRFDFPHKDAEYIHYNLHEPLHDTGLPLRCVEYKDKLMEICETPENVNSLFFNNAKHYWFRFNFEKKLDEVFIKDENNKQELKRLFKQQCHCRCFTEEYEGGERIFGRPVSRYGKN